MRAVAVPRKAKLRAKIMHRVVRPTKAFIPRQRHVAEGGCTTWVHRTAASAKCSLLHQMRAAEQKLCCANVARRAECSAFRLSEMRLGANAALLHQMQAAEKAGCSWLSERCCANGARRAECSACSDERDTTARGSSLLPCPCERRGEGYCNQWQNCANATERQAF